MSDYELIEAMKAAFENVAGARNGTWDAAMRVVLAVVRAHDSAELVALRAELESAHAAQRHAEKELSQYMAWYAMAEHQHLHEQRRAEKAEAERDAALVAVKAMHKLLDRDWAIVDRDITLRCESHDQAWNYLHEMRDLVRAALGENQ